MAEAIKQEIINNIYENGENLITGPVLQEVLLDMVDDYNDKVSSGSVPQELLEKTGSWDDAADWVEDNSGSLIHDTDLDGYATEQWVEDQGYLKEVPEGYATTESLNQLSESIAQDLGDYATKEELNETSESVKDWVRDQRYLTTASLSGSVTEETVQFMINDATASVENWVENKNYATENYVSESIASLDIPDTSGFVTTESYNQDSASFDERINAITGSDLSGYATTESLNQFSESVAQDLEGKADKNEIPDISGLATTQSVNNLSESIAADSASFDQRIDAMTASSGQDTELRRYLLSANRTASLNDLPVPSNLGSGSSNFVVPIGADSDLKFRWTPPSDRTYTITVYNTASSDVNVTLTAPANNVKAIVNGVEGTASISVPSKQYVRVVAFYDNYKEYYWTLPATVDLSSYATTSSVNTLSSSIANTFKRYATTQSVNQLSESVAQNFANLNIPDVSGLATTSSVNSLSQSVASDITSLSESIAAITGSSVDLSGYLTTASYLTDSASFDQRIDAISSSIPDLSEYATTASVNSLSSSISNTFNQYATTQSLNSVSQSLSASIAAVSGSGVDLSALADNTDPDNPVFLALQSSSIATWNEDDNKWDIDIIREGQFEGEGGIWDIPCSPLQKALMLAGIWKVDLSYDENENVTYWYLDIEAEYALGSPDWKDNPIAQFLSRLHYNDGEKSLIEAWYDEADPTYFIGYRSPIVRDFYGNEDDGVVGISASFIELSESVAAMTGSDLSGYATTESVNNLSSSVGSISSSFADTIANLPTGSSSGNYLPITGGTVTGPTRIFSLGVGANPTSFSEGQARIGKLGVGTNPGTKEGQILVAKNIQVGGSTVNPDSGDRCLAVGSSGTNTNNAHYSIAVGENCSTNIYGGFVAGRENVVDDNGAFGMATGFRCRTNAMAGYAGGCRSTASANFATAIGFGAEARSLGQVVLGSYNEYDPAGSRTSTGSYAVILANGKSSTWHQDNPGDISRSNGLAIKWDGGIDINYSGSTITLQDKIAELEQNSGDLSIYATTQSVNQLSESVASTFNSYTTTQSFNQVSESFDQRITSCSNLQNFLFGIESCSVDALDCVVTNLYCSESANNTLGFVSVPEEGRSIAVDIQNLSTGSLVISILNSYTVDQIEYTAITNGVGYQATQSLTIPGGQHGNVVIMRRGTDLFLRTSITLTDYEAIFTRLASLEARVQALEGSSSLES